MKRKTQTRLALVALTIATATSFALASGIPDPLKIGAELGGQTKNAILGTCLAATVLALIVLWRENLRGRRELVVLLDRDHESREKNTAALTALQCTVSESVRSAQRMDAAAAACEAAQHARLRETQRIAKINEGSGI